MESRLADLYGASLAAGGASPQQATHGVPPQGASGDRTVQVVIEMADAGASPPPGMGIRVEATYGNLVQVTVPIQNLGAIASYETVTFVRLPFTPAAEPDPPVPDSHLAGNGHDRGAGGSGVHPAGASAAVGGSGASTTTVSEGVTRIGADMMHGAGYTGEGVRVAVIDSGFDVTNPEISGNIAEYASFRNGSAIGGVDSRHGTGAAEIVVDVAPGVDLHLYNINTDVEFSNLVDYLVGRGDIDIVSMSLGWGNTAGPRDGTNVFAQKVTEAAGSGILWVNSAGNYAEEHWSGRFSDTDGDRFHNFGAADRSINIDVDAGQSLRMDLTWYGWNSPPQDFALGLYDDGGNPLDWSDDDQHTGYLPHERVVYHFTRNMTAQVAIYNNSADSSVDFHLFSSPNIPLNEYAVAGSSIGAPADSPGSFSVGAYHHSTDVLANYSSWGPTLDGRVKPDISGPTGVTTTAYHPELYGGTSAAAPHVAGAAALVMQRYPDATADDVQNLLEHTAANYHAKSNRDGTGRVDLSMFPGSDILALNPGNPVCASDGPCFFPQTLRVAPGDTVTWANADVSPVRIADAGTPGDTDGQFGSSSLARGQTYSATFPTAGTFDYVDSEHPWASGRVIVGSGAPPPPPDADADGIPDAADLCPAEPETVNGFQDADGCPDTPPSPTDSTYSGARADTVGSITVVTNGSVTGGVPRASDFGVRVGPDPWFAPAAAPVLSDGNTTITLTLPPDRHISSGDVLKVRYDKTADSTSNLAAFPEGNVTNNVYAAPRGLATAPSATAVTLYWDAIADAPPDGRYLVQSKQRDAPGGWGAPVDRGASGTNHTFGGLSPSTPYDLRVYLANGGGERISDYGTANASTAAATPAPTAAAVTGRVFNDTDRDRLPGDGEPGIPGISVLVYDYVAGLRNDRLTDEGGNYAVAGISPGQTALSQIVLPIPSGHLPSGGIYSLFEYAPLPADTSDSNSTSATVNFPLYLVPPDERGTVVFDVYHDVNGNGAKDDGEPGVPGATVYTFELLTYAADVQATGPAGVTVHSGLVPDVVLAQISYSDPATGALLLPDGFTRITTANAGAEYVTVAPGSTTAVQIGLGR